MRLGSASFFIARSSLLLTVDGMKLIPSLCDFLCICGITSVLTQGSPEENRQDEMNDANSQLSLQLQEVSQTPESAEGQIPNHPSTPTWSEAEALETEAAQHELNMQNVNVPFTGQGLLYWMISRRIKGSVVGAGVFNLHRFTSIYIFSCPDSEQSNRFEVKVCRSLTSPNT